MYEFVDVYEGRTHNAPPFFENRGDIMTTKTPRERLTELSAVRAVADKAYLDAIGAVIDRTDLDAVVDWEISKELAQRAMVRASINFTEAMRAFISAHPDQEALSKDIQTKVDASVASAASKVIGP